MVALREQVTVRASADEVWKVLEDPALVASCIPGAALGDVGKNGSYSGSLTVKFGPTTATFRGEVSLNHDQAARSVSIEGRGVDQRGASHALGTGLVSVKGGENALIAVDGDYSVTGPLQMFASAGGVYVARALLATFADNIAALVTERRARQEGETAAHAPASFSSCTNAAPAGAPRELDGLALFRQIVRSWFAGLIRKVFR